MKRVARRGLLRDIVRLAGLVLGEEIASEEVPLAEMVVLKDRSLLPLLLKLIKEALFSSFPPLRGGGRGVERRRRSCSVCCCY